MYTIKVFLLLLISCSFTALLTRTTGISIVFSAALVGLLGSFLPPRFFRLPVGVSRLVVYIGSFIGMTDKQFLDSPTDLMTICGLGTISYFLLKSRLNGLGGKLGTIAFAGSAIFVFLKKVLLW